MSPSLTKTKTPELHRYWTTRDRGATRRLFRLAQEVLQAIEAEVFPPRPGVAVRRLPVSEPVLGLGVSLTCPRCGGRHRLVGAATAPHVVRRLLAGLGLAAEPPPVGAAVATATSACPGGRRAAPTWLVVCLRSRRHRTASRSSQQPAPLRCPPGARYTPSALGREAGLKRAPAGRTRLEEPKGALD